MAKAPLGTLRFLSLADGLSYLVLLGIAMPLKYLADWPWGVKTVGPIHGALFLGLIAATLLAWRNYRWPLRHPALIVACAFLPFAPFLLDRWLKKLAEPILSPSGQ